MSTMTDQTASAVADWLQGEARAHRLDPVVASAVYQDEVRLVVRPADHSVWMTWVNLLGATGPVSVTDDNCLIVQGSWAGVPVTLIGLDADAFGTCPCGCRNPVHKHNPPRSF
jgi:hypothetical protein